MKTPFKKTEEKLIKFIRTNNLISSGDKILIALSGGADSVFLLLFLYKYKKMYNLSLGALHVNHMLRGKAALKDEKFCKRLCDQLNVEYYSARKNVKLFAKHRKISSEEAGRIIRYKILKSTALKFHYNKIATAHNSNDNAETILLNLIKGTGLKGLSGIPYTRENIIRPVLPLKKEEILKYLEANKQPFRTDLSNLDDIYERNFIRNNIVPAIKEKLNPAFEDAVFNTSSVLKSYYSTVILKIEELLKHNARRHGESLILDCSLVNESEAIRNEFIRIALERNFSAKMSFKEVAALSRLFSEKRGSGFHLSCGLEVTREQDKVVIFRKDKSAFTPSEIKVNENIRLNDKKLCILRADRSMLKFRKPDEEFISADDLDDIFIIREWQKGDKFFPLGMKGSKKISDFLNEKKIESYLKHKILLLTNRDRIVWVVGLRLDNRFRITNKTKTILKLCLK